MASRPPIGAVDARSPTATPEPPPQGRDVMPPWGDPLADFRRSQPGGEEATAAAPRAPFAEHGATLFPTGHGTRPEPLPVPEAAPEDKAARTRARRAADRQDAEALLDEMRPAATYPRWREAYMAFPGRKLAPHAALLHLLHRNEFPEGFLDSLPVEDIATALGRALHKSTPRDTALVLLGIAAEHLGRYPADLIAWVSRHRGKMADGTLEDLPGRPADCPHQFALWQAMAGGHSGPAYARLEAQLAQLPVALWENHWSLGPRPEADARQPGRRLADWPTPTRVLTDLAWDTTAPPEARAEAATRLAALHPRNLDTPPGGVSTEAAGSLTEALLATVPMPIGPILLVLRHLGVDAHAHHARRLMASPHAVTILDAMLTQPRAKAEFPDRARLRRTARAWVALLPTPFNHREARCILRVVDATSAADPTDATPWLNHVAEALTVLQEEPSDRSRRVAAGLVAAWQTQVANASTPTQALGLVRRASRFVEQAPQHFHADDLPPCARWEVPAESLGTAREDTEETWDLQAPRTAEEAHAVTTVLQDAPRIPERLRTTVDEMLAQGCTAPADVIALAHPMLTHPSPAWTQAVMRSGGFTRLPVAQRELLIHAYLRQDNLDLAASIAATLEDPNALTCEADLAHAARANPLFAEAWRVKVAAAKPRQQLTAMALVPPSPNGQEVGTQLAGWNRAVKLLKKSDHAGAQLAARCLTNIFEWGLAGPSDEAAKALEGAVRFVTQRAARGGPVEVTGLASSLLACSVLWQHTEDRALLTALFQVLAGAPDCERLDAVPLGFQKRVGDALRSETPKEADAVVAALRRIMHAGVPLTPHMARAIMDASDMHDAIQTNAWAALQRRLGVLDGLGEAAWGVLGPEAHRCAREFMACKLVIGALAQPEGAARSAALVALGPATVSAGLMRSPSALHGPLTLRVAYAVTADPALEGDRAWHSALIELTFTHGGYADPSAPPYDGYIMAGGRALVYALLLRTDPDAAALLAQVEDNARTHNPRRPAVTQIRMAMSALALNIPPETAIAPLRASLLRTPPLSPSDPDIEVPRLALGEAERMFVLWAAAGPPAGHWDRDGVVILEALEAWLDQPGRGGADGFIALALLVPAVVQAEAFLSQAPEHGETVRRCSQKLRALNRAVEAAGALPEVLRPSQRGAVRALCAQTCAFTSSHTPWMAELGTLVAELDAADIHSVLADPVAQEAPRTAHAGPCLTALTLWSAHAEWSGGLVYPEDRTDLDQDLTTALAGVLADPEVADLHWIEVLVAFGTLASSRSATGMTRAPLAVFRSRLATLTTPALRAFLTRNLLQIAVARVRTHTSDAARRSAAMALVAVAQHPEHAAEGGLGEPPAHPPAWLAQLEATGMSILPERVLDLGTPGVVANVLQQYAIAAGLEALGVGHPDILEATEPMNRHTAWAFERERAVADAAVGPGVARVRRAGMHARSQAVGDALSDLVEAGRDATERDTEGR